MDIGDIFRKATRPIITIILVAVIAQVVVESINAPDWFIALATSCIVWWFGNRTITHIKERNEKTQKFIFSMKGC